MKKYLALLLALVLALGVVLTACGGDKAPETTAPKADAGNDATDAPTDGTDGADDEAWKELSALVDIPEFARKDPEHMSWMDDTSPVTLDVYYTNGVGSETYPAWGSTAVQQHITELTGVTVNGLIPNTTGGSDAMTELTLMIGSGDPLPGIMISFNKNTSQYKDLAESGALYDIKELAEQYAPTLLETLPEYVWNISAEEDGHVYGLAVSYLTPGGGKYFVSNGLTAIRADICEDMGVKAEDIQTIADVEKYLQYVVDNQANYPELKHPVIMNLQASPAASGPLYTALGGIAADPEQTTLTYNPDDDSLTWWFEDQYGKEALKIMRDWVEKGFITEESFASNPDWNAEASAGSGALFWGGNSWFAPYANETLVTNGIDAEYVRIRMPHAEGVEPKTGSMSWNPGPNYGIVITKDCENPERAIKFIDFLASEYGNITVMSGVYGEDWVAEVDETGKTVAKPMNLQPAEGELPRGTYNYNTDWIYSAADYDFVGSYSSASFNEANKIQTLCPQDYVWDVFETLPGYITVPGDSDAYQWKAAIQDILTLYVPKIIMADEAEFETLYQEMLDEVNATYSDDFKEWMLGEVKAKIEADAAVGIEYARFFD